MRKQLEQQDKQYREQLEAQEQQIQEMAFNEYFNKKVQEGKVVPKQKEMLKAMYFMAMKNDTQYEFGEGTDKRKVTGKQIIDEFIGTLDKRVEYSEVAPQAPDPNEFSEQDKFINEYYGGA